MLTTKLYNLKELIEEYLALEKEHSEMCHCWEHGDASDQACSDPGLQYELEEKMEAKYKEIEQMWNTIHQSLK